MIDSRHLGWHVAHDPCRAGDRFPAGAVRMGEKVCVVLRADDVALSLVKGTELLVRDGDAWAAQDMDRCEDGFTATIEPASFPHVVHYAFRLSFDEDGEAYYVPRVDGRSTTGEVVFPDEDGSWTDAGWAYSAERLAERPMMEFGLAELGRGFQITVFEPRFAAPEWFQGSIMYQIFPDRFARGSAGVRQDGLEYHKRMRRPVHLHESWDDPIEWKGEKAEYDPVDFFGGSLAGVREALPYLSSLGVEVIYFNPVFEARSNHRYDTADYERIDPLFGDEDEFRSFVEEARTFGISIVLDAVLSHTGDDSRYFNAHGTYENLGAAQGLRSPYFGWYDFSPQPNGAPYRSWWGHLTLPEVNEHAPSWQSYILGADGDTSSPAGGRGLLAKWIDAGVRGYRLDVADELPDDVLSLIRTSVKSADGDAVIIGEVWEDPTTKVSYGVARDYALGRSLDSVMNYPLRNALLGFAIGNIDALQLASFLKLQNSNYPEPLYASLMNLLSSHDVERVRSVLSIGRPLKQLTRVEQRKAVRRIGRKMDVRGAQLQRLVAGIMFALPGAPCIYYGDERGMHGGGDPFCRATFPWSSVGRTDCGEDLTAFYQQIGQLRKGSSALRHGAMACCAPHEDVLCIVRALPEEGACAVVVANRSGVDRKVVVDLRSSDLALPDGAIKLVPGVGPSGLFTCMAPACSVQFFE